MIKTHADDAAELEAALLDVAGRAVARLRESEFAALRLRDRLLLRVADLRAGLRIGAEQLERIAARDNGGHYGAPAETLRAILEVAALLRMLEETDPREDAAARAALEARKEAQE